MSNKLSVLRILFILCISLLFSLSFGSISAFSLDQNYVLVDHEDVYITVPTFPGTVTSYTMRGDEDYSVGYYVDGGAIIGDDSLLADDATVTSLDLDLIVRDDRSDYSDEITDYIFNSVIATGAETDLTLTGCIKAFDDSDGAIASDFSARGTMITATDYAKVLVDGMRIYTDGFVRAAFIADDRGQILVKDSRVIVMGADPLTEADEDYYNSADQSIMISPPWVLGIQGGARLANMLGGYSVLTVIGSKATSGGWGVLSTDAGYNFVMNVVDSKLEILPEKRGGMSSGNFPYSHKYGSGYGTYIIGNATENFYGTTFKGTTYASILTGGDAYYMSSRGDIELYDAGDGPDASPGPGPTPEPTEDPELIDIVSGAGRPTTIHSVFGFMAHNDGSINVLDGTVVQTEEATFLYKAGNVDFVSDEAVLHPKSGIILQMIDNDDSTVGLSNNPGGPPPPGWAPIFNIEFFEDPGWPSKNGNDVPDLTPGPFGPPTPNNVSLTFTNGNYKGDVLNGTGYYTQLGDNLYVSIGEGATLKGAISLTETRHIDEYGDQKTNFTIDEYYYLGHVENRNHRNDFSTVGVTLQDGGVWKVTGESLISSLLVEDGAIVGEKGKRVVMTVNGLITPIEQGVPYAGNIVIKPIKKHKKYNKKH